MSAPTRIALILDPLTALAGAGRHLLELGPALARRGHVVRAFGAPAEWIERGATERPSSRPRLGASVVAFRPDVLIAYDALSPAAFFGARHARSRGTPLILVEGGAWSGGRALQRCLRRVGEVLWGNLVRRSAAAVIALDPVARDLALARGFDARRVELVPHGLDLERYRPGVPSEELRRHGIRGRILSCVAPAEAAEEVELLIAAFARTVGQRDDWSLVIATDGAPVRLKSCADRLGVGARVHCLAAPEAALAGLLASSTLFAAPADHGEAALLDVARALACGVPAIVVDAPRTRDLVRDGENGLVVPPGDLAAWCARLQDAASSPERRRRWGRAARATAEARVAWPSVAARFEAHFEARREVREERDELEPRLADR
jgi:glycosyltransferase involved in cell wall biosynthesis